MEFTALKNSNINKRSLKNISKDLNSVVLESSGQVHTVDVDGQSMNIALLTDKIIEGNGLKCVTDPVFFKNGNIPTDGGLYSPEIFGETPKEKARNYAYIDLKRKFFHPYIYEILVKLYRNFDMIASGQGVWHIEESGNVVQITDTNDSRYNEDNTGIDWLVKNFHNINFKETDSPKRQSQLKLLQSLSDDEIFISKWIVIPVFFRDVDPNAGRAKIPEISNWYAQIMMNVASYDNEILSISKHITLFKIQKLLVTIRKFGQSLIEKKNGAFQKSILGKAPDFGGRGVISVPSLNGCDKPSDCLVDIIHSGIPLSYCISLGYPFIIKWIMEFFEETFRNRSSVPCYVKGKDGKYTVEYKEIEDQTEVFTRDYVDKKLEMFMKTYGAERFETIKLKCKDGTTSDLYFPGKGKALNPNDKEANTIFNRPLTWTDVIYLAAENTLSDKYCYITRYPLEDYFGTFPSKVKVLSTIKTAPVVIGGKVYENYPIVDLSLPPQIIATKFIDTFSISNLYLDAIGGDYDGDTVSVKLLFSIEANEEAAKAVRDIKHYVSIQGKLVRVLGNEAYLTFYNMTRRE